MRSKQNYTISDLSKIFDITPRTIRFYEDEGLVTPKRNKLNRVYDERDFVRLKLIMRGKRIGFSLVEINETMKLYDSQPNKKTQLKYVLKTIQSHRDKLEKKKRDIEIIIADMDDVQKRIENQLSSITNMTDKKKT